MMRLPHTDNAEHLWAFKKGYRFAQQGKPLREMPLTIRTDRTLRDYFQQGYDQAQQQLHAQPGPQLTPKKRALWLLLTLVAGLATAKLMIDEMRQTPQTAAAPATASQPASPPPADAPTITADTAAPASKPAPTATAASDTPSAPPAHITLETAVSPSVPEKTLPLAREQAGPPAPRQDVLKEQDQGTDSTAIASDTPDFSLLDAEARAKQLQATAKTASLPPVTPSSIQVARAVLAAGVQDREPVGVLEDVVPKSMRRVYFFTQIKGAKGQTLTHRWHYGNRVMAEIRLPIRSDNFRTWSSKRMSPAWAGRWWVEVVDEQGRVIARRSFRYLSSQIPR